MMDGIERDEYDLRSIEYWYSRNGYNLRDIGIEGMGMPKMVSPSCSGSWASFSVELEEEAPA